jgi:K+-transporting ATPase ATPase A chain
LINAVQALSVILILGVTIVLAKLIAPYIVGVFKRKPSRLDKILNPIENFIYKITGVNPEQTMGWKQYFLTGLLLNVVMMVIGFLILVFQDKLPLNPMGFTSVRPDLAFNTVVSFVTNTNLQHYYGETTLSYLSQIGVIQWLQFTSAITGLCMGIAFIRGLIVGSKDMGNFNVDFTRSITRIFLPLCIIASIIFLALGVPQTLNGYTTVKTIEGASQSVLVGPVASLDSIMQIGTNGGGFYGANAAYPFMNPSPYSNVLMISLMLLLPTALIFVFGEMIGKKSESRPLLWGAYILFGINLALAFIPAIPLVAPGIETRFGGFTSTFYTVTTTVATTGSVNSGNNIRFHGHVHSVNPWRKRSGDDVHGDVRCHNSLYRGSHVWKDTGIFRGKNHGARCQTCYDCVPHSPTHHTHTYSDILCFRCGLGNWAEWQLCRIHTNSI